VERGGFYFFNVGTVVAVPACWAANLSFCSCLILFFTSNNRAMAALKHEKLYSTNPLCANDSERIKQTSERER